VEVVNGSNVDFVPVQCVVEKDGYAIIVPKDENSILQVNQLVVI